MTPLSPWAFGGGTDRPQNPEGEGSRPRRIPTPGGLVSVSCAIIIYVLASINRTGNSPPYAIHRRYAYTLVYYLAAICVHSTLLEVVCIHLTLRAKDAPRNVVRRRFGRVVRYAPYGRTRPAAPLYYYLPMFFLRPERGFELSDVCILSTLAYLPPPPSAATCQMPAEHQKNNPPHKPQK